LIAGLGHLARTDSAHVRDALAEGQQNRAHPLKIRFVATDHDRQATRFGADHSARHRRIQPTHAALAGKRCGHFPRGRGFKAGEIHQQLAAFPARSDTVFPEHHLTHHRRVRQTHHHNIRVLAQFSGRRHLPRTGLDQGRALGRIAVPHRQRISRRQKPPTHRQAHQADSGEPQ